MPDVTIKRVEEMEAIWGGSFVRARASLGATSFGMNIWNFPPNWEQYWEHNHVDPPAEKRKITTGTDGVQLLCVGGAPGEVYDPLPIVELGGPTGF